jgi:hypothetical protein
MTFSTLFRPLVVLADFFAAVFFAGLFFAAVFLAAVFFTAVFFVPELFFVVATNYTSSYWTLIPMFLCHFRSGQFE